MLRDTHPEDWENDGKYVAPDSRIANESNLHLEHLHPFSETLLQLVAVYPLKWMVTLCYAGRNWE